LCWPADVKKKVGVEQEKAAHVRLANAYLAPSDPFTNETSRHFSPGACIFHIGCPLTRSGLLFELFFSRLACFASAGRLGFRIFRRSFRGGGLPGSFLFGRPRFCFWRSSEFFFLWRVGSLGFYIGGPAFAFVGALLFEAVGLLCFRWASLLFFLVGRANFRFWWSTTFCETARCCWPSGAVRGLRSFILAASNHDKWRVHVTINA
jgi:hypothetical protein